MCEIIGSMYKRKDKPLEFSRFTRAPMTIKERKKKAEAAGTTFSVFDQTGVKIVVAGDSGTRKSTLIKTATTKCFHYEHVREGVPETELPINFYADADPVPVKISDTSSRGEDTYEFDGTLKKANLLS